MTDLEIIIEAKKGNLAAFRLLVENHQTFVYRVAFRLLSNKEEAEDAVQECFIRVWKNLKRFNVNKKLTTWLYCIITNLCYDRLRRAQRRNKGLSYHSTDLSLLEDNNNPEKIFNNKHLLGIIKKLVYTLPPKQKIVFILRDLEDRDINNVADILNLSHKSVKSNLYFARKQLRTKLMELKINNED